ncbi:hypothetical protein [Virgibacillus litoralis]|uniref:DUF3888 domain-containing protein n=1 Tax=Virgibacillus litoralis TaxID=578221 RepID=A0ABS4HGV2_9BACI|nr:hypothetical protein [Virgibacillus litoralis]MBP1949844.1 hypothetical protein [Virgibacillus litoralis]
MKITAFIIIIVMTLLTTFAMQFEGSTQHLFETLKVNPKSITKISLSPPSDSSYNSTTEEDKIQEFIHFIDRFNYKKIRGNEPAYLPMTASMIYLYEDGKVDFIVSFEDKVMINQEVFEVKNGEIKHSFVTDYYKSLE